MALQFAYRCVEVEFRQFLDPAGLEQSEVLPQSVARYPCEPTNLLVFETLALQPEGLHAPTHSRMCVLVTQLLNLLQILPENSILIIAATRSTVAAGWQQV